MPAFFGIPPLFWDMVTAALLLVFGMTIGIVLAGLGRAAAKPQHPPISQALDLISTMTSDEALEMLGGVREGKPIAHPLDSTLKWHRPMTESTRHPLSSTQDWTPPDD
jgi:hypothetical protein